MSSDSASGGAHCPFCSRSIPEELAAYGGRCPHCFCEVPGEDAPTDPGEDVRKADVQASVKQAQKVSKLPYILLAVALLIPVGTAVYLTMKPKPKPVLNLDLEEYALGDLGEIVAMSEPVQPASVEPASGGPRRAARRGGADGSSLSALAGRSASGAAGGDAAAVRIVDGASAASNAGPRSIGAGEPSAGLDVRPAAATGSAGGGMPGFEAATISVQRRDQVGVVLRDDDSIIDMVKAVVQVELPKLRTCYEHELKTKESLAGTWTLDFVVSTSGQVTKPKATGRDAHDAPLEACLVERVKAWKFQPIASELPVSKKVAFRPN